MGRGINRIVEAEKGREERIEKQRPAMAMWREREEGKGKGARVRGKRVRERGGRKQLLF